MSVAGIIDSAGKEQKLPYKRQISNTVFFYLFQYFVMILFMKITAIFEKLPSGVGGYASRKMIPTHP